MFAFLLGLVLLELACSVNVQGPIFVSTTWKRVNNPYVLVGDYQVARGVTLTISQGTQVIFTGNNHLLIKGNLIIQGSSSSPVKFSSNDSSSIRSMILFKSTNLSFSLISYCQFFGPRAAIQLAEEALDQQDPVKNSGNLQVDRVTLNNSQIQTNGVSTGASVAISNANILNSTIVGFTVYSEKIFIVKSKIAFSFINSGDYNDGISIDSSQVTDCRIRIGHGGANVLIDNSRVQRSSVMDGPDFRFPAIGPFKMNKCNVTGLTVSLPAATVEFNSCNIINNNNETIKMGLANIFCSDISGNRNQVGLEVTGILGYSPSSATPQNIRNSSIYKFAIGLAVSGGQTNLTISRTNFYQNTQFNLQNISPRDISAANNWWGKSTAASIRNTIFDYYKNINYGEVLITNYSISKLINNQC